MRDVSNDCFESICLRVYGMSAPDVDERLASLARKRGFFNNQHIAAMTLYATQFDVVEQFRSIRLTG